jgi:hypothetical protein
MWPVEEGVMGGQPLRLPGVGGGEKRGGSHGVGKSQPGSGGAGETTKPTGGARVAVTEGEGVITGLHKLEVETAFGNYAKAA